MTDGSNCLPLMKNWFWTGSSLNTKCRTRSTCSPRSDRSGAIEVGGATVGCDGPFVSSVASFRFGYWSPAGPWLNARVITGVAPRPFPVTRTS